MASSATHQQLVRLYANGLSLPALSFLALITGFTFSLTLLSSRQALLPAMESLFLVSLPHLWRAWITPPCLFVLLNGIIMILTATSGRSSSSWDAGNSEMDPNLANQVENVAFKQIAANLGHAMVEPQPSTSTTTTIPNDTLQIQGPLGMHIPLAPPLHMVQNAEHAELEPLTEVPCHDRYGHDDNQLVLYMNLPAFASTAAKIDDPEHDGATGDDPSASSSPVPCEEIVKAGSEPSSPHFSSSPAVKDNNRRSMSIDSVSFIDNSEGASSSSEQLSEEAFKKRIDDFILKVNSKIRSETRVKN